MMDASKPFELSRVYGMGWTFVRGKLARGEMLDEADAAALNPHSRDPERARWADGFKAGLRGWRGRLPSASPFRGKR
jgi:hypothetical protein